MTKAFSAPRAMPEANPYPATVVFFGLADFGTQPVAAQAQLKEGLEFAIAAALAPIQPDERIVVETRDGAAVVLLDEPDAALDLGERVRAAAPALPLRVGINHGPVKLALAGAHGPALLGDVLAAGAAVAGFAKPGATLVSRSYREALARTAPNRAKTPRSARTRYSLPAGTPPRRVAAGCLSSARSASSACSRLVS